MGFDALRDESNGAFSWSKYAAQKTIHYVTSFLSIGMQWLQGAFPVLETVNNFLGFIPSPTGTLTEMVGLNARLHLFLIPYTSLGLYH
jgi:hypothetical protein